MKIGSNTASPASISTFVSQKLATLREAYSEDSTNTYRCVHGASDGWDDFYLDRFGDYLLISSRGSHVSKEDLQHADEWMAALGAKGLYHRKLDRHERTQSPRLLRGESAPESFIVKEWGASYIIRFTDGYSVGLFIDQKENRLRILQKTMDKEIHLPAQGTLLNTFSYTCSFSVAGALAGYEVTSLDLSQKYIEWGKSNFAHNAMNEDAHDFIYGDAFDWMKRLRKKGRLFDIIILDPPSFSHTKTGKYFKVDRDYPILMRFACELLKDEGGWILACANHAKYPKPFFKNHLQEGAKKAGRQWEEDYFFSQSKDHPWSKNEPPYLKTFWIKLR